MHNFNAYNDLSDFSFYKTDITNFGIQALLIFDNNGLPVLSRYYVTKPEHSDNDFLIVSAFISSMAHYITNYTKEFFTDFGIGTERYYLKFIDEKIYCIIVNEIIGRRITGESLTVLMELSLNQLVKNFTVYHSMTKTTKFVQLNYIEKFIYQIDTVLFFNFKNAVSELKELNKEKKHEFDNFKIFYSNSDQYGPINHQMLIKGILGLIIFDKNNEPLIIRDYALERDYVKNIEYYGGITMAIKKFADLNFGVVTDIGLGNNRALIKIKKHELIVVLFINEVLYWRITGEILSIFMELTLKDILRSFSLYLDMFNYKEKGILDPDTKKTFNEQIDLLLLENSKVALKELDKNFIS